MTFERIFIDTSVLPREYRIDHISFIYVYNLFVVFITPGNSNLSYRSFVYMTFSPFFPSRARATCPKRITLYIRHMHPNVLVSIIFKSWLCFNYSYKLDRCYVTIVGWYNLDRVYISVALKTCKSADAKNGVIQFTDVKISNGIYNADSIKTSGIFTCENPWLYLISVYIVTHDKHCRYYMNKNTVSIADGFSSLTDFFETTSVTVIEHLTVNDRKFQLLVICLYTVATNHV